MNVDEAIARWKQGREMYDWPVFPPTAMDVVVAEIEWLRAELAAAKAASELPQVIDCYSFGDDVEVVCKCGDDADRLSGWIRERMKENSI